MLQFIRQEQPLGPDARIVLHYLVRLREEALFHDAIYKIKQHFGNNFDGHIWITRQESHSPTQSPFSDDGIEIHYVEASGLHQVGQSWEWWNSFSSHALDHFDSKETRERSLVYICGPQGLTDRLVEMYKEHGMHTEDGHVQVEKWW